jgi:hypothetical protein
VSWRSREATVSDTMLVAHVGLRCASISHAVRHRASRLPEELIPYGDHPTPSRLGRQRPRYPRVNRERHRVTDVTDVTADDDQKTTFFELARR